MGERDQDQPIEVTADSTDDSQLEPGDPGEIGTESFPFSEPGDPGIIGLVESTKGEDPSATTEVRFSEPVTSDVPLEPGDPGEIGTVNEAHGDTGAQGDE